MIYKEYDHDWNNNFFYNFGFFFFFTVKSSVIEKLYYLVCQQVDTTLHSKYISDKMILWLGYTYGLEKMNFGLLQPWRGW